jgi:hypothetical protein
VWLLGTVVAPCRAEVPRLVAFPEGPGACAGVVAVGASLDVLPRRLVESEWRAVPRVTGRSRLGLGHGLYLSARVSAIVISNDLQLGLGWGRRFGSVAVGVHEHVGFWYGMIGVEGFDATGWGVLQSPGISVATDLRGVLSTLSVEALILQARHVVVADASLTQRHMSFEGVSVSFTFENPLSGGSNLYYGLSVIYSKPDYQLWLAFSDVEERQVYPRYFVGYAF